MKVYVLYNQGKIVGTTIDERLASNYESYVETKLVCSPLSNLSDNTAYVLLDSCNVPCCVTCIEQRDTAYCVKTKFVKE